MSKMIGGSRSCPPGVFCLSNSMIILLVIVALIVIGVLVMMNKERLLNDTEVYVDHGCGPVLIERKP